MRLSIDELYLPLSATTRTCDGGIYIEISLELRLEQGARTDVESFQTAGNHLLPYPTDTK